MQKINILDNKTINKIAAGEVVERPASIVKELVENSIDAKATAITIEIKNGGISFIRITDNGTGIPKEEVKTAFIRHATSKIKDEDDLSSILSLGFRGEALASIAAVSEIEIITKEYSDLTGIRMQIEGGNIVEQGEIGCPEGTTLIVKNIFFNTPARRKFLKTEMTEASYIDEIVRKMALGHPEISFKFINNNNVAFFTSGNSDLSNVIFNIYGRDIANNLLEVRESEDNIKIEGFIAKPEVNRANRMYENFFINGRYIKSALVENALEEAFKPYMMIKRFPLCVLKIEVLPDEVDVNVHPAKTEVRFKEEEKIKTIVQKAVKQALEVKPFVVEVLLNEVKEEKIKFGRDHVREAFEVENKVLFREKETYIKPEFIKIDESEQLDLVSRVYELEEEIDEIKELKQEEIVESKEIFKNYRIVGQVFNTYWIIEQDEKMYMIDQHAAHEKVLYEKLVKQFKESSIVSQQLLQPIVIDVSIREKELIINNEEIFRNLGFEIDEFGANAFAIRAVPIIFNKPGSSKFFLDIIDEMISKDVRTIYENKEDEIAKMACKAAVKANDRMSFEESRAMIESLMKLENPFFCPHGRPVIISMDKYEIEKKFKRIV